MTDPDLETFESDEKDHYDRKAGDILDGLSAERALRRYEQLCTILMNGPQHAPYSRWREAIASLPASSTPLRILDYCAGQGHHTLTIQHIRPGDEVTAIDISEAALEIGRQMAAGVLSGNRPSFIQMNAHSLTFENDRFDLVSEFESFSSLEFPRAIHEILRVLKPGGLFIAVETLGHNPILNLKRRWNVLRGNRTKWAADHIFTMSDLAVLQQRFNHVEVDFYGLTAWIAGILPFGGAGFLGILERFDRAAFRRIPYLRRYAFKVFIRGRKA